MLNSMTGFGRSVVEFSLGKLVIEIQSVNRKHLEVLVQIPKEWGRFESEVRKGIAEKLSRGHVVVRIFFTPHPHSLAAALPDRALVKELKKGWEQIAQHAGLDPRSVDLPFLIAQLPEQTQILWAGEEHLKELNQGMQEALKALLQMRQKEGKALALDLKARLKTLEKQLGKLRDVAPEVVVRMRQKLKEKIEEALAPSAALDERLLREVAFFAERTDIAEELTRLASHFQQFADLLETKADAVGRKMEFLIQELGREINTIGSKCAEATTLIVDMKAELEKMREQIQNIE